MSRLTKQSTDAYFRRRTPDEVLCILKATEAGRVSTEAYILSYVARNFASLCTSHRFLLLNADHLAAILQSRDLIAHEVTVLRALVRWVRWDAKQRKQEVSGLVPLCRIEEHPLQCCAVVLANWDIFRLAE